MTASDEQIFLQFGALSNSVGTHYWNAQVGPPTRKIYILTDNAYLVDAVRARRGRRPPVEHALLDGNTKGSSTLG